MWSILWYAYATAVPEAKLSWAPRVGLLPESQPQCKDTSHSSSCGMLCVVCDSVKRGVRFIDVRGESSQKKFEFGNFLEVSLAISRNLRVEFKRCRWRFLEIHLGGGEHEKKS